MADLDSDSRQLLIPEADHEVHPGPMNIQFESSDLRSNRPFHVEPTNIVGASDVVQRVSDRASAMSKRIHYYGRLAAPADQALVAPDHVVPAPEERYVYSPLGSAYKLQSCSEGSGKNSSLVTIFMIWNTMMGTSILSIPWGIKQAGFTTGVCVILLMGLLTLYCCYRVVRSRATIPSVDTSAWEFPDVCRHYFGAFGQWSSLLFSLVSLVGAMVVYWVLMSNFLFNTGKFVFNFIHHVNDTDAALRTNDSNPVTCPSAGSGRPDNGSAVLSANATGRQQFEEWWDKSRTVPFYLVGPLLPLLSFRSPSFFSRFNVLGALRHGVRRLLDLPRHLEGCSLGISPGVSLVYANRVFCARDRSSVPAADGRADPGFLYPQLCYHTPQEQQEPGKQREGPGHRLPAGHAHLPVHRGAGLRRLPFAAAVQGLHRAELLGQLPERRRPVLRGARVPAVPDGDRVPAPGLPGPGPAAGPRVRGPVPQRFPRAGPEPDYCGSWREHGLSVPQHRRDHQVLGSSLRPGLRVRLPVPHPHPLPPPRGPPDVAHAGLPRPHHRPGPGQPGGSVLHVTPRRARPRPVR
ncbi:neutral amino acid transporter 9 isoform X1 [Eptesicus fuscus]|uniref:neutral amino acid transporter 9 isoform X1 n=1 Tax=Eptesicus fuscus TaxID=29078 RepID=UPI0024041D51|nr:neutral amino acid transporter 9 isoform X1 [Eptesicus fuscus]XP_054571333.1 neutral amino acid transporter 9 isoform X1 [Eptesicus fuscus]XP_054571334.1 neutral amino acid transporter 9 isoform X1 [Eptesicus fuscus]